MLLGRSAARPRAGRRVLQRRDASGGRASGPRRRDPARPRSDAKRQPIAAWSRCCGSTRPTISTSSTRRMTDWRAAGRDGDAFPYTFPVVGRRPLDLSRIDARSASTVSTRRRPIAEGTWDAAYWARRPRWPRCDAVLGGERSAFALCRPPGHHAGADYLGGYSYLNNAAIAAEAARRRRARASRSSTSTIITATARRTSSTTAATSPSPRSMPIRRPTIRSSGAMRTRRARGRRRRDAQPAAAARHRLARLCSRRSSQALDWIARLRAGPAGRLLRRRHLRRRPDQPLQARRPATMRRWPAASPRWACRRSS